MQLQPAKLLESQKYTMKLPSNICSIATGKPLCFLIYEWSWTLAVIVSLWWRVCFLFGQAGQIVWECNAKFKTARYGSGARTQLWETSCFVQCWGLGRHHPAAWLHDFCLLSVALTFPLPGSAVACCVGKQKAQAAIPWQALSRKEIKVPFLHSREGDAGTRRTAGAREQSVKYSLGSASLLLIISIEAWDQCGSCCCGCFLPAVRCLRVLCK